MPLPSFSDLPSSEHGTLASSPPRSPRRRPTKSAARRLERCCCQTFAYCPLLFVSGLTTWAVWVEVSVSFLGRTTWSSHLKAGVGVALWTLLNVSYSVAVFTSPGSPLDARQDWSLRRSGSKKGAGYEGLPTHESEAGGGDEFEGMTMVTAKRTGQPRYCKKCHCVKPDRVHHCSTCGKCVLKMDHHCPWLATCVGLRNYKAFLLFLLYTSTFCWYCFGITATWVWAEIMNDTQMEEGLRVVNTILLAVLGGVIGLVLSGFTAWHLYLTFTNQTTIESLEKTRYLTPLRKQMQPAPHRDYLSHDQLNDEDQPLGERFKAINTNALPGVLRPEEGEDSSRDQSRRATPEPPRHAYHHSSSPVQSSLQRSYASLEAQREQERYEAYLDEQDSEKLPNAFNLGWRRNLSHVFGDQPMLWWLPICNTKGDGWAWEISPRWAEARDDLARERERKAREDSVFRRMDSESLQAQYPPRFEPPRHDYRWTPGQGFVDNAPAPHKANTNGHIHQHSRSRSSDIDVQMQPLDRRKNKTPPSSDPDYDTSSDEDVKRMYKHEQIYGTDNWNDVPDEPLGSKRGKNYRSQSRGRRKGD